MNFQFYLRESLSDVDTIGGQSPVNFMSDIPGSPIELDYVVGSNDSDDVCFISPAAMPNKLAWDAGVYTVRLTVVAADSISVQALLARVATDGGVVLYELGGGTSDPQTAAGASPAAPIVLTFTFTDAGSSIAVTDRLALFLFAQNTDPDNAHTFSIMASQSVMTTPIPQPTEWSLKQDFRTRGKFLGKIRRPGEGAPEGAFDQYGVDLPC